MVNNMFLIKMSAHKLGIPPLPPPPILPPPPPPLVPCLKDSESPPAFWRRYSSGYDERFPITTSEDLLNAAPELARIRRAMVVQERLRTLENPNLAMHVRADWAHRWLTDDGVGHVQAPSSIILQLWQEWSSPDSPPPSL